MLKLTEINNKNYQEYYFKAFEDGELFYWPEQSCIFMKIEPIKNQYPPKQPINAICLNDGKIAHFKPDDKVYLVIDAELKYELEKS